MGTFRLGTGTGVISPVRPQTWNASIRAGDDFKLALTVHDTDGNAPAAVRGSHSRLVITPDVQGYRSDYGMHSATSASDERKLAGYVTPKRETGEDIRLGGINFALSPDETQALQHGRYRIAIQVDLVDGSATQIEGVLQVRQNDGPPLGRNASYFQFDRSQLDGDEPLSGDLAENGVPVDADGFYALGAGFLPGGMPPLPGGGGGTVDPDDPDVPVPGEQDSIILGTVHLGHQILGPDGGIVVSPDPPDSQNGLLGADGASLIGTDGAILLPAF